MKKDSYKRDKMDSYSKSSAEEIVPYLLKIIKPKNIVDVGCGVGTWLNTFKKNGIKDILGIDGPYVDKRYLVISKDNFLVHDLKNPIKLNKKFDLVISLEVAEHLQKEYSKRFVESLINLGDLILFSAAIPYQGGTNHFNEQWQSYWADLFKKKGYLPIDCIRPKFWDNPNVEWFYSQNMFLYAKKGKIKKDKKLKKEFELGLRLPLSIVHPKKYELSAKFYNNLKKKIPKRLLSIIRSRFKN